MKPFIPFTCLLISGISCAPGQLGPPAAERAPEQTPARVHASWTVFVHPKYGYALPIPPGVRSIGHPEDLTETSFESADGSFLMSAWGGTFHQSPAEVISARWDLALRRVDRNINYHRRGGTWFVVSGTDQEGIEYYEKFIMRGHQAAFVRVRLPRTRLREFEAWVEKIEDGFGLARLRGREPAMAVQLGVEQTAGENDDGHTGGNIRGAGSASTDREDDQRDESPDVSTPRELAKPRDAHGAANELTKSSRSGGLKPSDHSAVKEPPVALKVEGKPGFVYSPFHPDHRLVDVVGVPSGKKMKCPYTMKIFRVP